MSLPWRGPLEVARAHAGARGLAVLCSDGGAHGRWSYLARDPELWRADGGLEALGEMLGPRRSQEDGPPFQGGAIGLLTYDFAARLEAIELDADPNWPGLTLLGYRDLLAFDHLERRVLATSGAAAWLEAPEAGPTTGVLAEAMTPERPAQDYERAVAEVTGRIAGGEIFQANIARAWRGRLKPNVEPFDAFERLMRTSPAPFGAFLGLGDRALVSHSPERFVCSPDGLVVETRPIKGTRPRGRDPGEDEALAAELLASAKDRAENLMIVDLMRNDLSRVCAPGSVKAPELFAVETYPSVHHLVSTVRGRLLPGRGVAEVLAAAFPPGSITGAPKVQAMKVIAELEGAPRGAWCGSLFWAGFDGAFDSSVLIRTAAFARDGEGWRFRTLAGAGIVADSDPAAELAETEAKIAGLRWALTEA